MDDFELDSSTETVPSTVLDPKEWKRYTGSTDSKGHYRVLQVPVTAEDVARMSALIPTNPDYRTLQDVMRAHLRFGGKVEVMLLRQTDPVLAAEQELAVRRMESQAAFDHEQAMVELDEDYRKQASKMMDRPPTLQRIKMIRNLMQNMTDASERRIVAQKLADWAGEMG